MIRLAASAYDVEAGTLDSVPVAKVTLHVDASGVDVDLHLDCTQARDLWTKVLACFGPRPDGAAAVAVPDEAAA